MTREFPLEPGQQGLATRQQLFAAGWTGSAIRHALSTTWQQPAPGVYAPHQGPLDDRALLSAAALWAGPKAVLTGASALRIYGLDLPGDLTRAFLVPQSGRARRSSLAGIQRTRRQPAVSHRSGCVAVAPPARALVDLARLAAPAGAPGSAAQVRAWILSALQRRTTTVELLTVELREARSARCAAALAGLRDFGLGAWSLPEVTLREVMSTVVDVRSVVFNRPLATVDGKLIGTPDAYVASLGLAAQVHSTMFHTGEDAAGRDLLSETFHRDARLSRHGIIVVPVTPRTLDREPQRFVEELTAAIARCQARPTPDVVIRPPGGVTSVVQT